MSARIISAKEAHAMLGDRWDSTITEEDLAHTVVVQTKQIAAALALHHEVGDLSAGLTRFCEECDSFYPCETARALGVTA